jgi:ABC-type transport system involved in cytochrome bd biosynthesis fused ATPase/permease subunit
MYILNYFLILDLIKTFLLAVTVHIVVFDNSSIVEYGTHTELIHKQDGIYAKMFETQAQYYLNQ